MTSKIDLWQGDCLELMKKIPDGSIDLVVTSPPYDNLRTYNGTLNWNFEIFSNIAKELTRVLKKGGVIVWVVGDATIKGSETGYSFRQALYFKDDCGLNLHDTMIFKKQNPMPNTAKRYTASFEYMFVFANGPIRVFNKIEVPCKLAGKKCFSKRNFYTATGKKEGYDHYFRDTKKKDNVWEFLVGSLAKGNDFKHPAKFPYDLAADHIKSWSNKGDIVLDCFLGSGTTGLACKNLNRDFIGIELDESYFKIAQERIADA